MVGEPKPPRAISSSVLARSRALTGSLAVAGSMQVGATTPTPDGQARTFNLTGGGNCGGFMGDAVSRRERLLRGNMGLELGLAHLARGHRELAMAACRVGVPFDPHIVGRIEESRIDMRPLANDPLQKSSVPTITASHPVIAEDPDVAWFCSWCQRGGMNDFAIRIVVLVNNHIDLTS